jgi:Na+-driven multidrug efflux pump
MTSEPPNDNHALDGAIVPTFFKYLLPSLVGLIAMTSASLVDGIFIGNYVGITALAAVNLIIPITTVLFGVGMMLSIGGSMRAGKYLGEGNLAAASAIFSKTLMFVAFYGVIVISLGLVSGHGRVLPNYHAVFVRAAYRYCSILFYTPGRFSKFGRSGTGDWVGSQYCSGLPLYPSVWLGSHWRGFCYRPVASGANVRNAGVFSAA